MKSIEKNKIQKNIENIQNGNFDETNIESLFMSLRPYCKGYQRFHEIADFVAHNDVRDRGLVNKVLEKRFLNFNFIVQYTNPRAKLDFTTEIPSWIIKLIKYQVNDIEKDYFLNEYGSTRRFFLEELNEAYIIDSENKIARYSNKTFSINFWNALKKCLSFIKIIPPLTQDELLKEIIGVLKTHKITIKEKLIRKNSNKIIICTLLLLHKTKYKFEEYVDVETFISYDSNIHSTKKSNNIESLGNLEISGLIRIKTFDGNTAQIVTPIFSTNLKLEEWCDTKLRFTEINHLELDEDIILDNQFKISKPTLIQQ